MSWEVLAAAAAAARSLDELLLSHGAEGRSSGNLKYPLKQQKAHSLVLTQIIQPGTRSRKTARAGEKSLSPLLQEPLDYMFHISPHQRRDVIFPALFNSRLSTQFVEKHERLQRSPKAGRARGSRGAGRAPGSAHLAGADKSRNLRTGLLLSLLLLLLSRDHKRSSRRGGSCCRGSPLLRGRRRRLRGARTGSPRRQHPRRTLLRRPRVGGDGALRSGRAERAAEALK